jgi:site-specific recombinase XerC
LRQCQLLKVLADYFNPPHQDGRIAKATLARSAPTLDQIRHALAAMPVESDIEKRDRAVFAVAILSGTRDDAIASMAVRHVDVTRRSVFHDARVVRTKNRKTFMSAFFPVGEDMQAIVAEWISFLAKERMFGPDDPLFPATIQTGHGDEAAICRQEDRLLVWQLGSFLQRSESHARRRSRLRSRRTMRSRVVSPAPRSAQAQAELLVLLSSVLGLAVQE